VGDRAHQAEAAAPVDEADAAFREEPARRSRRRLEGGVRPATRAAEDAKGLERGGHSTGLGPQRNPVAKSAACATDSSPTAPPLEFRISDFGFRASDFPAALSAGARPRPLLH